VLPAGRDEIRERLPAATSHELMRGHRFGDDFRGLLPEAGTFVAFLAERFPHEVLPARRPRLALTGWFRRRT